MKATRNKEERASGSVLGDINPEPMRPGADSDKRNKNKDVDTEWMEEDDRRDETGSNRDRAEHSGSRDVTEGTTGGTGPDAGGSRNYRTGSGVTGTEIGNRPK